MHLACTARNLITVCVRCVLAGDRFHAGWPLDIHPRSDTVDGSSAGMNTPCPPQLPAVSVWVGGKPQQPDAGTLLPDDKGLHAM